MMSAPQEGLAVTVAITIAAITVVLAVLVALLGDRIAGQASAAGQPSAAGQVSAACQEWTDSCVICTRTAQGQSCSTPGIACVRGPVQCLKP
jgi:invasion protein IalB